MTKTDIPYKRIVQIARVYFRTELGCKADVILELSDSVSVIKDEFVKFPIFSVITIFVSDDLIKLRVHIINECTFLRKTKDINNCENDTVEHNDCKHFTIYQFVTVDDLTMTEAFKEQCLFRTSIIRIDSTE
ncbi:unnamed protein product [Heterobilharzia americana]|nr:unnamed protein product [Heterobilharzia americana]